MPPKGEWKPSLNIKTVLLSIQLLMSEPNLDDPLMVDVADQLKMNKEAYLHQARRLTKKYAV